MSVIFAGRDLRAHPAISQSTPFPPARVTPRVAAASLCSWIPPWRCSSSWSRWGSSCPLVSGCRGAHRRPCPRRTRRAVPWSATASGGLRARTPRPWGCSSAGSSW